MRPIQVTTTGILTTQAGEMSIEQEQTGKGSRTCRCGHNVGHPAVEAKPAYGFWGWLKLLNGISTLPKKVEYRCKKCGSVVAITRAPDVLHQYR